MTTPPRLPGRRRPCHDHQIVPISAVLTFDAGHDLVDFVSDDRSAASEDGKTFTQRRWSTPLAAHRDTGGRRLLTSGEEVWHAGEPEGSFTYLEFHLDAITYNGGNDEATTTTALSSPTISRVGC